MGPHSFECGNLEEAQELVAAPIGFNGAALVRVRKCLRSRQPRHQLRASMGPHSFECGNAPKRFPR